MKEAIDKVLEEIKKQHQEQGKQLLGVGEEGIKPEEFSKERFRKITPEPRKTIFIDGGNAELVTSPAMCLSFVRIATLKYTDNKREACNIDEFYVLCSAKNKDGRIKYAAKLFKAKAKLLGDDFFEKEFVFDALDRQICEGNKRAEMSKMPGIMRRIAELTTAKEIASVAEKEDIIVIDGDLNSKAEEERRNINALKRICEGREMVVCAVSKTSDLLTSNAEAVGAFLSRNAPEGSWDYLVSKGDKEIRFAKLHPASGYVFKIETFGEGEKAVASLASNSNDAVFLGYPYGLVEADKLARVPNKEAEALRMMFMAKAGKEWKNIEAGTKASDAHSVLDRISY
jgi:hypothetical protein